MSDIADVMNVRASALYRHFSGKQDLLDAAVTAGLADLRAALDDLDAGSLDDLLRRLAHTYVSTRGFTPLWEREIRHLPADRRAELRRDAGAIPRALNGRLASARTELSAGQAELVAWCALNALASVAYQPKEAPARELEDLAYRIAVAVSGVTPAALLAAEPSPDPEGRPKVELRPRREAVLDSAVDLFARHGYPSVTLDQIGDAAGITGATIYNYFSAKQQVLHAVVVRATQWIQMSRSVALRSATDHPDALRRVTRAYVGFALEHHGLLALLVQECGLPEEELALARETRRGYVEDWADLLRATQPGHTPAAARIRINAAMAIAFGVSGSRHLRALSGIEDAVHIACTAALTG